MCRPLSGAKVGLNSLIIYKIQKEVHSKKSHTIIYHAVLAVVPFR